MLESQCNWFFKSLKSLFTITVHNLDYWGKTTWLRERRPITPLLSSGPVSQPNGLNKKPNLAKSKLTSLCPNFVQNDIIPVHSLILLGAFMNTSLRHDENGSGKMCLKKGILFYDLMLYLVFRRPLALALDCKLIIPFSPKSLSVCTFTTLTCTSGLMSSENQLASLQRNLG